MCDVHEVSRYSVYYTQQYVTMRQSAMVHNMQGTLPVAKMLVSLSGLTPGLQRPPVGSMPVHSHHLGDSTGDLHLDVQSVRLPNSPASLPKPPLVSIACGSAQRRRTLPAFPKVWCSRYSS